LCKKVFYLDTSFTIHKIKYTPIPTPKIKRLRRKAILTCFSCIPILLPSHPETPKIISFWFKKLLELKYTKNIRRNDKAVIVKLVTYSILKWYLIKDETVNTFAILKEDLFDN
jgi:hypothetical protein